MFQFGVLEHTVFPRLNHYLYDFYTQTLIKTSSSASSVVIVDIDEKSINAEGRWPWSRDKLAKLVDRLQQMGAVVIGFDIIFATPEENLTSLWLRQIKQSNTLSLTQKEAWLNTVHQLPPIESNDVLFAKSLSQTDAVLGFFFNHDPAKKGSIGAPLHSKVIDFKALSRATHITQYEGYYGITSTLLNAARATGFTTNQPDADGVLRKTGLIAFFQGKLYGSLSLQVLRQYLISDDIELLFDDNQKLNSIVVSNIAIPVNEKGEMYLPFYGRPYSLPYFSATDILNHALHDEQLMGAIVFVGSSATLLSDSHQTPVSSAFPGVELNANVVKGILEKRFIYDISLTVMHIVLGVMLVSGFFIFYLPIIWASFLAIFLLLGTFILGWIAFQHWSYFIPFVSFWIGIGMSIGIKVMKDFWISKASKKEVESLFSQYVPTVHIKALLNHPELMSMAGESKELTVLFLDVRQFTTLSEKLPPHSVKLLLNQLFTPITKLIFDNHGTIDKYVGDMVMAFWGAPLEDTFHALHAVLTSLMIYKALRTINVKLSQLSLPTVDIGIGISTGVMNVGDMGSDYRRAYTVIGDEVNIASRSQDLTKFYGVHIIATMNTKNASQYPYWRFVDKVAVKGRSAGILLYTPIDEDTYLTNKSEFILYDKAITLYFEKDFINAHALFKSLKASTLGDSLTHLFLKRSAEYIKKGVDSHWTGVFVHTKK
jgi:adenylate cyclase